MAGTPRPRLSSLLAAWSAVALLPGTAAAATSQPGSETPLPASRIAAASAPLLGRPYRIDPLGEGDAGSVDRDPLWRTDAFDCQTFVETVLAIADTSDPDAAFARLQQLRYAKGDISFGSRNHFPDADWLPNNIAAGFLRDVTRDIADAAGIPDAMSVAQGRLDRGAWLLALPRNPIQAANLQLHSQHPAVQRGVQAELQRLAAQSTPQPVSVAYLRLRELSASRLAAVLAAIPDGSVLLIVRPNTSLVGQVGAVTQISHLGFVLNNAAGVAQYRNASSGRAHQVLDTPLLPYLQRMQRTRSFAGVVVLQPLAAK